MIHDDLLTLLQCPECQNESPAWEEAGDNKMKCASCGVAFPVADGVPDMTPNLQLAGERWEVWKKHLQEYRNRDDRRAAAPSPSQLKRWAEKEAAFAKFIDATEGSVLEIGCGPASIRNHLADGVTYFGLDPLPSRDQPDFPFLIGVAEYLPFRDDSFDFLIVRSALDHFCYLDQFFAEATRIMRPGGRLFIEQVIHEVRGPVSAAKVLAHNVKDWLDDRVDKPDPEAPKHISEFSRSKLMSECGQTFEVTRSQEYNRNWYTPTQVFLCLEPKAEVTHSVGAVES